MGSRTVLSGCAALLLSLAAGDASAAGTPPLLLVTEENAPYTHTDPATGRTIGIAGELVQRMMERAGVPYRNETLPWDKALKRAETEPGTCVYATAMSAERLARFRWVGPLTDGQFALFGAAGRPEISSLEDLRGLRVGAPYRGPFEHILRERGYNVVPMDKLELFGALREGRIDVVAYGLRNGRWQARQERVPVKVMMTMLGPNVGLACHPATDPATLARLDEALQWLHADGTAAAIHARYD
jgi:polar amino acid transport system substrate-binding protein